MRPRPTVLYFSPTDNDPARGLIASWINGKSYPLIHLRTMSAVEAAARRRLPALIVVDADTAGPDAPALCRLLKTDPYTAIIPVAVISARHATGPVRELFEAGADEVITPLFEPPEQRSRLDVLLQRTERNVAVHPSTRLPGTTEIVATDLNQPMLDFAAAQPGAARATWRSADALALPFFDKSFDVVVCQFGAMFFPDKVAAYREALRVLRPGGSFVLGVWDRIEDNEFAEIVTGAVGALFPGDPPSFLKRTPHGYHDATRIRGELASAGFATVAVETIARRSQAAGYRDPAIGYCQGTPLRNEIEARDASRLGEATEAAAAALGARFGFGPVDGKIQAHVITAAL